MTCISGARDEDSKRGVIFGYIAFLIALESADGVDLMRGWMQVSKKLIFESGLGRLGSCISPR